MWIQKHTRQVTFFRSYICNGSFINISVYYAFVYAQGVISIWQSNNKSLLAVYVMALFCNNFQRDNHSIYAINNIIFISYDYQCLWTHNVFI